MKSVELVTSTGFQWETSVSEQSTLESVCQYFLGKWFDVGIYPKEKMEKVEGLRFFGSDGELIKDLTA